VLVLRWLCVHNLALWADAPVDHFGFIDYEAVVIGGMQAWGFADSAVDIRQISALPAHHMVVVVADAGFVAGNVPLWLDLPDDAQFREELERIVDRLV
jgi:hypothetical protein